MHPKAHLSTLLVALAIPVPTGYVTGVPKSDESPVQSKRLGPWFGFLLCIHSELDQDGERICGSKYSFWNPWNYTESKLSKQTVLLTLGGGGGPGSSRKSLLHTSSLLSARPLASFPVAAGPFRPAREVLT